VALVVLVIIVIDVMIVMMIAIIIIMIITLITIVPHSHAASVSRWRFRPNQSFESHKINEVFDIC
jgi:hypothetical protein